MGAARAGRGFPVQYFVHITPVGVPDVVAFAETTSTAVTANDSSTTLIGVGTTSVASTANQSRANVGAVAQVIG